MRVYDWKLEWPLTHRDENTYITHIALLLARYNIDSSRRSETIVF